jgi:hypothetical protein
MAADDPEGQPVFADSDAEAPERRSGFGTLLGRAKAARDQAQASVTGFASQASEVASSRAGELKSQVSAKAGDLKGQVAARASELRDATLAKLAETLDDFNAALPVVREAGYTLSDVSIAVGLPPTVTASFDASSNIASEQVEALLAQHADKKLTVLLVRALHQAWQLQQRIHIAGLRPQGLSVELGLVPAVTVKFA